MRREELRDLISETYAFHERAGLARPTLDELAAATGEVNRDLLCTLTAELRFARELPDLDRGSAQFGHVTPAEAAATAAAIRAAGGGKDPIRSDPSTIHAPPSTRELRREHLRRERTIGIGVPSRKGVVSCSCCRDMKINVSSSMAAGSC